MIPLSRIRDAAARIAGKVHRTPLLSAAGLGARFGASLHLKCENLQKTGSFKPRGALNAVLQLSAEQRACGIVTLSAGNHGQGLAFEAGAAALDWADSELDAASYPALISVDNGPSLRLAHRLGFERLPDATSRDENVALFRKPARRG